MSSTRRNFLASAALAGAASPLSAASAARVVGANDRVRFALIGCGGMGRSDLRDFLRAGKTQVVGLCDVDPAQIGGFSQLIAEYQRRFSSAPLTDYRILRVDYRPGEGRWPYIVIMGLLLLLFLSDLRLVVRIIRTWR